MGAVYFVDKLVNVDRVECFSHVEGGENCSLRGFLLKPLSMVLLIWSSAVVVECAALKPC